MWPSRRSVTWLRAGALAFGLAGALGGPSYAAPTEEALDKACGGDPTPKTILRTHLPKPLPTDVTGRTPVYGQIVMKVAEEFWRAHPACREFFMNQPKEEAARRPSALATQVREEVAKRPSTLARSMEAGATNPQGVRLSEASGVIERIALALNTSH